MVIDVARDAWRIRNFDRVLIVIGAGSGIFRIVDRCVGASVLTQAARSVPG
jgi:hypothetical protein